ncbi:hypothetical protein EV562_103289 [Streptomyces sp. BK208]|uniref:DUF6271 family protein n=1 Tax=Streptomyces sp. BK208 TaxID=2512150 RepID=UPI0010619505|nr:DUF6271 family protein [Streptomyces sp. BK208]TDT39918.1 hypothetical protein EV562_103289 [Streptomyces sp. BK208]
MRSICLTLPTDRPCPDTVTALGAEAAYAADHFDIDVHLVVLDSCPPQDRATHADALRRLPVHPRITAHHLDETAQRAFLTRVAQNSGSAKPELLLDLMLPDGLSYGACTNRAFLIAAALGCDSVHRRDSDSRYQRVAGRTVFPVHHELLSLGRPAADAVPHVTESALPEPLLARRVAMVGGSFVGELSVDIARIRDADPGVYQDVVSLWAPEHWPAERKRELVEESFTGAGTTAFARDHALLTVVDPMRVDMCNIAFHGATVSERVPLPPARDTIGSDYFLIHLVHDARLPGVLHNRHIVNYYTGERRTGPGFLAYQTRFAKFLLSMLYFHHVYDRMAEAGDDLLDEHGRARPAAVAALARESTGLDTAENVRRLDALDAAYRQLGGEYADVADHLAGRRERLLDEARGDMTDFALLTEAWEGMVAAAKATALAPAAGRPR